MKNLFYHLKTFFQNLYNYRKILWTDQQFDFGYLLELEKCKLQLMLNGFKRYSYDTHMMYWITICIKLIDIIQENDSALEWDNTSNIQKYKLIKYVNIKNASRFNSDNLDNVILNDKYQIYRKDSLRRQKALYLYNKIRYNYICEWWD